MSTTEEDIIEERRQWERVKELAALMAEECPWIWRHADGYGGAVLNAVVEAYGKRGMHLEPREPSKRKQLSVTKSLKVFARDGYKCLACGSDEELSVDHIQPVSKGGTNDMENLQTLCRPCNSRKGAKWAGGA